MSSPSLDHIHLRARDPEAVAAFLHDHFDCPIIDRLQVRGLPRVVMRLDDTSILIEGATGDAKQAPTMPYRGIEHICIRVSDIAAQVARLEQAGIRLHTPVSVVRPGVTIAFVEAPDGIFIELIERSAM